MKIAGVITFMAICPAIVATSVSIRSEVDGPNVESVFITTCKASVFKESDFKQAIAKWVHKSRHVIYMHFQTNTTSISCQEMNCSTIIDPYTWIWSRHSGHDILALPLDYDILSMGLLSDNEVSIPAKMNFEPYGCDKEMLANSSSDFVKMMKSYIHAIIWNATKIYRVQSFHICYRERRNVKEVPQWLPALIPYPVSFYINVKCTEYPDEHQTDITETLLMWIIYFSFLLLCMYFPLFAYFAPTAIDTRISNDTMSRDDHPYSIRALGMYFLSCFETPRGTIISCFLITVAIQIPCIIRYCYNYVYHLRIIRLMYVSGIPLNILRLIVANTHWTVVIVLVWIFGSLFLTVFLQHICRKLIQLKNVHETYNTFDCIFILSGFSGETVCLNQFCAVYTTRRENGSMRLFFSLVNRLLVVSSLKYWVTLVSYSLKPILPPCCSVHTSMPPLQRCASFSLFFLLSILLLLANLIFTFLLQNMLPLGAVIIMHSTIEHYPYDNDDTTRRKEVFRRSTYNDQSCQSEGSGEESTRQPNSINESASETSSLLTPSLQLINVNKEIISSYFLSFLLFYLSLFIIFNFYAQSISNVFEFAIFTVVLGMPYYPPQTIPTQCMIITGVIYFFIYLTDLSAMYTDLLQIVLTASQQTRPSIVTDETIPRTLFRYVRDHHHPLRAQILLLLSKCTLTGVYVFIVRISLTHSSMLMGVDSFLRIVCYVIILSVPGLLRHLFNKYVKDTPQNNRYDSSIEKFVDDIYSKMQPHPEAFRSRCYGTLRDMSTPVPI